MSEHVVPRPIDAFNTYLLMVYAYLVANATRLGVTTTNLTALNDLITASSTGWTPLFVLHSNPNTRTSVVNAKLAASEVTITHKLEEIYADIPRSAMTEDDYEALNIAPPVTHRARRGTIVNIPFGKVYSIGGAIAGFIIRTDTHAKRAAIDPLADAVEVRAILQATDAPMPVDPAACNLNFISKQALFSHAFSPADAGKRLACFLRFVNLTDETKDGGWSGVISTIIGL